VASVQSKVQNALDEGRILVLAVQVGIGFEYRSFFEPVFEALPAWARAAKLLGLCLLLVSFALVVLPGPWHQLVEHGEDTVRLHHMAIRAIGGALLPFALALGLELAVATTRVEGLGTGLALAVGAASAVAALALWYALPAAAARSRGPRKEETMSATPIDQKIRHVLTEARMVLPGAQALLGFQLAVTLMEAFGELPREAQLLHLADILLTTLAVILLVAPAAYHRIAEQGEETQHFHRVASRFVLAAMVPLAIAISGDLGVVTYRLLESTAVAALFASASLVLFTGAWFGFALGGRAMRRRARVPAHA